MNIKASFWNRSNEEGSLYLYFDTVQDTQEFLNSDWPVSFVAVTEDDFVPDYKIKRCLVYVEESTTIMCSITYDKENCIYTLDKKAKQWP